MIETLSHSPILQAIFDHAIEMPEKTAFVSVDGNRISYSELKNKILEAAAYLKSKGLEKGDKTILSAQKEIEFVYLYFGAHLLGIVNVVVDAKNNASHLQYISSLVNPKLAIGCVINGVENILYDEIEFTEAGSLEISKFSIDDVADIMFTSGTTGLPKGVLLTHGNIYGSASNINSFIGNTADDVELLGLPICHSFGLGRIRCNMLTGGTIVLKNGFANIKDIFNAFEQYTVTGFGMVPAVWAYIKRFSGSRISKYATQIRYIEIGSAAMPFDDKKLLCEIFPDTRICMHYGLTEASRSAFMEFHENVADLATIGQPVSDKVSIKIFDESGCELPVNAEGELCVAGNMVMKSYLLPQDNDSAFFGQYFRTGDWAYKMPDGRLYLVARKKELINVGGKKVSPVEVEDALSAIGVGESMCIAIKDPDGILGEVPKVLLVEGSFTKSLDDIKQELAESIESYKMPRIFEIVKSIPKTASGKKQRLCQN